MAVGVVLLLAVMSASFLNVPWPSPPAQCGGELCEIGVTGGAPDESITGSLFGPYAILVIISALVLAACMIGGVYLAKMEGGAPPP
jgi:NADH:ubiquinone oxidoreductase subunit 6 (subunit J)